MTEELFTLIHEKTMNILKTFETELKENETDFIRVVHLHIALVLSSLISRIPDSPEKGKHVDAMFKSILAEVNALLLSVKSTSEGETSQ